MLIVPDKINLQSKELGMDCEDKCMDPVHFTNYKKDISYNFNSRGFRDLEWPNDLENVLWCIGDSYTLGLGQPHDETWPQMLEKKVGKRCLNLGQNGASNDTICLRSIEISKQFPNSMILIMWTFLNRRRKNNKDIFCDPNNFGDDNDMQNFADNFLLVKKYIPNAIHTLVPNALTFSDKQGADVFKYVFTKSKILTVEQIDSLHFTEQLDLARDGFHLDVKTSNAVANKIAKKLSVIDN